MVAGTLDLKVWSENHCIDSISFYEFIQWQIFILWGFLLLTFSTAPLSVEPQSEVWILQWACDLVQYPLNLYVGTNIVLSSGVCGMCVPHCLFFLAFVPCNSFFITASNNCYFNSRPNITVAHNEFPMFLKGGEEKRELLAIPTLL